MNLRSAILKEHSKAQTMKIVKFIGNDAKKFKDLMDLFFNDEYRVVQRSAWAVNMCAENHPELIKPYLEKMIDYLQKPVHDAVRRNTVRILQFIDIPKNLTGKVASVCFDLLQSKKEPVAVKVFSMTVLAKICTGATELKNELRLIIEQQLPYSTAGFQSRAKRILKEIEK
ncbi:MAG TPA: hypothetical protein VJY62_01950 [Bacteroidia bacterium]|nr:hypothetical protein [Bacteroidia bacterium]